jgi:hypothetical protein
MTDTTSALAVINGMRDTGVIGKYAIGGAVAASFYLEPSATYDIDIFIPFDNAPGSAIASLSPIYEYLLKRGCKADGAHILVEGWQVQFLPADDALYKEAVNQAVETDVGGVKTWVMTAEHLMAIALKTGRAKDLIRVEQFVQHGYEEKILNKILNRHNLLKQWDQFNEKFSGSTK